MKKFASSVVFVLLVFVLLFVLSSCSQNNTPSQSQCQHQWIEANCKFPKTCRICYQTEGEPLGHRFADATCTKPSTCTLCGETKGTSLGHSTVIDSAIPATCTKNGLTEGSHCSVCNETLTSQNTISANGHDWGNPSCVTPRSCCVCFEVDPESQPYGHYYVQGVCRICGDDDPDYIALTLTSTKYNINLTNNSDIAYITMIGGETIVYEVDDTSVVLCEWGDWDGDTIPLTFYPVILFQVATHLLLFISKIPI